MIRPTQFFIKMPLIVLVKIQKLASSLTGLAYQDVFRLGYRMLIRVPWITLVSYQCSNEVHSSFVAVI